MLMQRQKYLERALAFRDTDLVKVVTGVRRCGKSFLLKLVRQHIEAEGKPEVGFVDINLESRSLGIKNDTELYNYVKARLSTTGKTYVFIDEVQRIIGWHDVVNSLRVEFDCDLYVTGSNAFLLSGELATYLSGRYVEIKMLPLSFTEFCDFNGLEFSPDSSLAVDDNGKPRAFDDVFTQWLDWGGMPALAGQDFNQEKHRQYLSGVYEAVVQRDILSRERNAVQRAIADPDKLRRIVEYLADTTGRFTSTTKIARALTESGRKTNHSTVGDYIKALEDAYISYPCPRYDIHGKAVLKTTPKHYLVDLGLRAFLTGYRSTDTGFAFENAVFLQLLFEGWNVFAGKLYQKEVDFVANRDGRVIYIQVTQEMLAEQTRERELAPLRSIRDNHEKYVVFRQGTYPPDFDGIRVLSAQDFFLGEH